MFRDVTVRDDEITSEAEWHYKHGDAAAYEAAAHQSQHRVDRGRITGAE